MSSKNSNRLRRKLREMGEKIERNCKEKTKKNIQKTATAHTHTKSQIETIIKRSTTIFVIVLHSIMIMIIEFHSVINVQRFWRKHTCMAFHIDVCLCLHLGCIWGDTIYIAPKITSTSLFVVHSFYLSRKTVEVLFISNILFAPVCSCTVKFSLIEALHFI